MRLPCGYEGGKMRRFLVRNKERSVWAGFKFWTPITLISSLTAQCAFQCHGSCGILRTILCGEMILSNFVYLFLWYFIYNIEWRKKNTWKKKSRFTIRRYLCYAFLECLVLDSGDLRKLPMFLRGWDGRGRGRAGVEAGDVGVSGQHYPWGLVYPVRNKVVKFDEY